MIKKLRWKFVLYSELSIFALLALILITANVINFSIVTDNADSITQTIADNNGTFGPANEKMEPGQQPQGQPGGQPGQQDAPPTEPMSPETRDSVRYFTVKIDSNGVASVIPDGLHMNAFTQEEAVEWGVTLANYKVGWSKTYYRYRVYVPSSDNTSKYVTVIDQGRELGPSYRVLIASIIGSAVGLVLSFLVLLLASKRFVKPLVISDKKQKRFISDASHELKTPLTIISANAELLELQYGENEQTTAIANQVQRLTSMVRELNELARLEEEVMVEENIDLSLICDETLDSFAPRLKAKNIEMQREVPDNIHVKKNETGMRHLLSIVLDNAAKYALSYVKFSLKKDGERYVISVTNDAENIPQGQNDRVFERFYRSDDARASQTEGSGIGLSIAKEIVRQFGGRIYARGEGNEFKLKIEF